MNFKYDPLDDVVYQQIDVGDRVYVSGHLDRSFFTRNEMDADLIISLEQS